LGLHAFDKVRDQAFERISAPTRFTAFGILSFALQTAFGQQRPPCRLIDDLNVEDNEQTSAR
jgi:hypothetical protein